MQITARALSIAWMAPSRSGSAEKSPSVARASSSIPRRACVAASHPVIRGASACTPVSSDLRPRCRRELFERRSMLPASGVQHARRHVQEARRRPGQRLARRPPRRGVANALPHRTRPSRPPCRQPPRARARRSADRRSQSARPGRRPDSPRSRAVATETSFDAKPSMCEARDLQVGAADRLGELGSLGEVPLGVRESP